MEILETNQENLHQTFFTWKLKDQVVINQFKGDLICLQRIQKKNLLKIKGYILKPTRSKLLKRFMAFPNIENDTNRLGGGITQ